MKKILLSGGLILLFIIYALHQHQEDTILPVVKPNLATLPEASNTPLASTPTSPPTPSPTGRYKNGSFTGSPADAVYGTLQVAAQISGGKIVKVQFLQYPNDRSTSRAINSQAIPFLQQEAIQAQSAQVDGVSGASDTSRAFIQSLSDALSQAS